MSNKKFNIDSIKNNQLFILPGVGVCRKTGSMTATDKNKTVRVIYPTDTVVEFKPKGKK